MYGYNKFSIPFIDLEKSNILIFKDFESFNNRMLISISKSINYLGTSYAGIPLNLHQLNLIDLYKNKKKDKNDVDYCLLNELSLINGLEYIKIKYDCLYIGSALTLRYPKKELSKKNTAKECVNLLTMDNFPFLIDEIKSWNIFTDIGRIVVLINDTNSFTPIHRDWYDMDEFIWISLSGKDKNFFIYDEISNTKHFIGNSRAIVFNNADYHGSDPTIRRVVSLRIDGKFNNKTKTKINELTK